MKSKSKNSLPAEIFTPIGYKIRKAEIQDIEEIAFVHTTAWKTAYKDIIDPTFLNSLTFKERLELRQKIYAENDTIQYVAIWKGEVIGFCDGGKLRFHGNQLLSEAQKLKRTEKGEIYALYILEEHQGKGVGQALFQSISSEMGVRGLSPFFLWALKDNRKACAFYEKLGGKLLEEISVKIGEKIYPEVGFGFPSE